MHRVVWPVIIAFLSVIAFSCGSTSDSARKKSQLSEPARVEAPTTQMSVSDFTGEWVDSLLATLSLRDKVAQMVMVKGFGHYISSESDEFSRLKRLVEGQKVGGIVMFQGDIYAEAVLLNKLQALSSVPLLVASDFERGVAMRVRRGTQFPDAMAIGATRNANYAYSVGHAIADEARAIGVHQNLAPVADVNNNPSNPVINTRSFGENPRLVGNMVAAFIRGTEDANVIATAKHFPGHGDTGVDSHLFLPVLPFTRARLDSVELFPFREAIGAGAKSVMVAHLAVNAFDSTERIPATISSSAITEVLEDQLGFEGIVITDAMDMYGLTREYSTAEAAVRAVQAGVDILLIPPGEEMAIDAVTDAVRHGAISLARIDSSVRKILEAKEWIGLDKQRLVTIDSISAHVESREHMDLAKTVARDAVTVVKNEGNLLPLKPYSGQTIGILIVSDADENRTEVNRPGYQYPNEPVGSYFMQQFRSRYRRIQSFKITPSSDALALDSVWTRLQTTDILVLPLYVKVRSSSGSIGIPENLLPVLTSLLSLGKPTVVVAFGSPYSIGAFPQAQALMCAYSDAEIMVEAAVEAIFGEINVRGRLPVTIPEGFPFGSGVEFAQATLREDEPEFAGFDEHKIVSLDGIIEEAIRDSAFPAAELTVVRNNIEAYNKVFGKYTYDLDAREIDPQTQFDLASLTKVIATTPAIMKLYDEQLLRLDDPVNKYIPAFTGGKKNEVTIRQLLTHTGGLPAFRRLWEIASDPQAAFDSVYATHLVARPGDTTIYSDLGMILLGKVVENITGVPLDKYVQATFYEPLGMGHTQFNPPTVISNIAPTEIDSSWRKALVRGTVHDENAAALGGVAGHAGLFSTASDLALFMQMIMNGGKYGGTRFFSEKTVRLFTQRENENSSRALGWDLKSQHNSSAGELFSPSSYGHLGFTGTSIWADPARNLFVILLTNRVYPTRYNTAIVKIRPQIHDAVINALSSESDRRAGT